MAGELCRQQGYRLAQVLDGVAVNADWQGRRAKAQRRGMTSTWPGQTGHVLPSHEFSSILTRGGPGQAS